MGMGMGGGLEWMFGEFGKSCRFVKRGGLSQVLGGHKLPDLRAFRRIFLRFH